MLRDPLDGPISSPKWEVACLAIRALRFHAQQGTHVTNVYGCRFPRISLPAKERPSSLTYVLSISTRPVRPRSARDTDRNVHLVSGIRFLTERIGSVVLVYCGRVPDMMTPAGECVRAARAPGAMEALLKLVGFGLCTSSMLSRAVSAGPYTRTRDLDSPCSPSLTATKLGLPSERLPDDRLP